jgi:hypothetical protein
MILEEQPRRGGMWPSQVVPDYQLFAQPLTEYQVAIVSPYCSPLSLSEFQVYGASALVCLDLRLSTRISIFARCEIYQI